MGRETSSEFKWKRALIGFIEECDSIQKWGGEGFGFPDSDLKSMETGSLLLAAIGKAEELASSEGHGHVFLQAQSVLEGKTNGINWKAGESDKYPALATLVACNKARRLERAEGQALEELKEYSAKKPGILVVPSGQDLEEYLRNRATRTDKINGDKLLAAAEAVAQVKKELGLLPQIGDGKTVGKHFEAIREHLGKPAASQGKEEGFGFGEGEEDEGLGFGDDDITELENAARALAPPVGFGDKDEGFGDKIEEDEHEYEFVLSGFDEVKEENGKLKVVAVDRNSPLREFGIEEGDVITSLSVRPKGSGAKNVVLGRDTLEEAIGDFKQDNTQTISMVVARQNEAGGVIYHKVTKTGGKDLEVEVVSSPKEVRFNPEAQVNGRTVSGLNDVVIETAPEREEPHTNETYLKEAPPSNNLLQALQEGRDRLKPLLTKGSGDKADEPVGTLAAALKGSLQKRRWAIEPDDVPDPGTKLEQAEAHLMRSEGRMEPDRG